jgi:hypothetical protein
LLGNSDRDIKAQLESVQPNKYKYIFQKQTADITKAMQRHQNIRTNSDDESEGHEVVLLGSVEFLMPLIVVARQFINTPLLMMIQ